MQKFQQPNVDLVATDEIFKPVKIYNQSYDDYFISNYGRLYSFKTDRCLCQKIDKRGYVSYKLFRNGKIKYISAHRLVAFAFVVNPKPKVYNTVNHLDENPQNNYYANLVWCTDKINLNYGTAQKRRAAKRSKAVMQFDEQHKYIASYSSLPEASKSTHISITPIFQGCHDGQLHKGYYWFYAEDVKGGDTHIA